MRLISTASLALLSLLPLASCTPTGKGAQADSIQADSASIISRNDYSDISFSSPEEVTNFLDFKKFTSPDGYIAFHGKGGVIDTEGFVITDIKIRDSKSAELSIHISKADLSGKLILNVDDAGVSILDEEAKTTYKLSPKKIQ